MKNCCRLVLVFLVVLALVGCSPEAPVKGRIGMTCMDLTNPFFKLIANVMEEDARRCLDAGCDDFVGKPLDRRHLLATIRRWLPVPAS